MAINPINNIGVYTAIMNNNQKSDYLPKMTVATTSPVKRDTAIISEAAKDLAAKMAGTSYQEEANESESAIMMENES